jgi:LysR family nitrogen assimilation transcriptional regulator
MRYTPRLNLQQMSLFLTVAELKSISSAAEKLKIAQPALSRQLRSMEELLGVKLLERHNWGVSTTHAGDLLIKHAQIILQQVSEAEAAIVAADTEIKGHVTLGLPPTIERAIAGSVLAQYHQRYPQVTLGIRAGYSGYVEEWLCDGQIDVGVLYSPYTARDLRLSALLEEQLYLIGPPTETAAPESVPLSHLADIKLILPGKGHGLRKRMEEISRREGISLNVTVEVDGLHTQLDLVMRGIGYTILPLVTVIEEVSDARLSASLITEPEIHRELVVATPVDRALTPAVNALIQLLKVRVEEMVASGIWPGKVDTGQ